MVDTIIILEDNNTVIEVGTPTSIGVVNAVSTTTEIASPTVEVVIQDSPLVIEVGTPGMQGPAGPAGSGGGGVTDHAALSNLTYAASGHTGFEPADATIIKSGNASWIDLTDSGTTTLHSHSPDHAAVTLDANADTLLSLSTQQLGLDTQTANRVFAGPTTGIAAVPTFRALVSADIPALSYGDISGTGVVGQVTYWDGTKTITGDANFTWDKTSRTLSLIGAGAPAVSVIQGFANGSIADGIRINGGDNASDNAASVFLAGGASLNGYGGNINMSPGNGTIREGDIDIFTNNVDRPGTINITGGVAQIGNNPGTTISIEAGASHGNANGGQLNLSAGDGGATGDGGDVTITLGKKGASGVGTVNGRLRFTITGGWYAQFDATNIIGADVIYMLPNANGTLALGAGTLTSITTNDVTVGSHTHAITPSLGLISNGSIQYQVLTTGATPFAPVYSDFYLKGTTGGSTNFAVTTAKTLTLTATDNFNLTIPATGTVALLGVTNVFTGQVQPTRGSEATNVFLGVAAGNATASGQGNVGLGQFALNGLTSGAGNIAFGDYALVGVTSGASNMGLGSLAAFSITTATGNVAIGFEALSLVTTGNDNIGIGARAGSGVTTGASNTFIGAAAGYGAGATIAFATYIGAGAGTNAGGSYQTLVGNEMGHNSTPGQFTGSYNAGVGYGSFAEATTAHEDTCLGFNTFIKLTSGSHNTALGSLAAQRLTTGNFNTVIGWNAGQRLTDENYRLVIDPSWGGGYADKTDEQERSFIFGNMDYGGYIQFNNQHYVVNAPFEMFKIQALAYPGFTPTTGFGVGMPFWAETATTNTYQPQALIASMWTTATNATRKADLVLSAYDTAAREGIRIRADGTRSLVGIDTAAPTARLHLPAGGTAANTAPLKFTQDATSLLTAVEAGAMEYYRNSLWFTNLAVRRTVVQAQSVATADLSVSNTTTETTIFTQNHGANYLQVGKMEDIWLQGVTNTASGAGDTGTVRVKYAGTTLGTFTIPKSIGGKNMEIHMVITCRAIGAGTTSIQVHANCDIDGTASDPVYNGLSAGLDSTTAQATTVTLQWATASASDNYTQYQTRALSMDNNA